MTVWILPGAQCISDSMPPRTYSISVRCLIWLLRAFGWCIHRLSPHLYKILSLFFLFLTKLLQNALSSKTLVFLSCRHLNINVIHPAMLLPNHISLSLQSYSGHRTRDCFALCVQDKRLKWSSILWITRITLQKSPGLGWFGPMRIKCAVSFVYLQNVPCTTN